MEGFKGTPGVWCVGMDGEILSDAGYVVMVTDLVHGNEHDRELIAAAPELLKVLQSLLVAFTAPSQSENWIGRDLAKHKAEAAIAKALGQ